MWAEFGIGAAIILLRFAVRIKTVGFKGFQGDDYFSAAVLFFWTLDAALVDIVCKLAKLAEADRATLMSVSRLGGNKCRCHGSSNVLYVYCIPNLLDMLELTKPQPLHQNNFLL